MAPAAAAEADDKDGETEEKTPPQPVVFEVTAEQVVVDGDQAVLIDATNNAITLIPHVNSVNDVKKDELKGGQLVRLPSGKIMQVYPDGAAVPVAPGQTLYRKKDDGALIQPQKHSAAEQEEVREAMAEAQITLPVYAGEVVQKNDGEIVILDT